MIDAGTTQSIKRLARDLLELKLFATPPPVVDIVVFLRPLVACCGWLVVLCAFVSYVITYFIFNFFPSHHVCMCVHACVHTCYVCVRACMHACDVCVCV